MISTQDNIAGFKIINTMGLVRGNAVRSRNIGSDFLAGLRSIFGGEIMQYTMLVSQTRDQALSRMLFEAERSSANAIVGFRFITSEISQGCTEILAYGTAVKVKAIEAGLT